VTTRSITLLPIGGVALLDRIPEKAAQELWIAVAGPAVNFVLAGLLFVVIRLLGMPAGLPATEVSAASFLPQLMWINLTLGLFNLLPAFPMDGGRIVRAALALKLEHRRATAIAARLGQIIAVALGIIGFLVNGMLMFVALFVWIGARQEAAQAKLKGALHGTRVKNAMITEFHTVHPDDELGVVADRVVSGYQPDFPVVEQGRLVGMLTRWDLFSGIARLGRRAAVRDAMNRQPAVAAPLEPLEEVVDRLTEGASVLVLEGGALVGILTSENVGEWLMMKEAPRAAAA
jgi:predicted transcriptional regulator